MGRGHGVGLASSGGTWLNLPPTAELNWRETMEYLTPLRAIRLYCLGECNEGGSYKKVKDCPCEETCPLHEYRSGHNIMRSGIGGNPAFLKKRKSDQHKL